MSEQLDFSRRAELDEEIDGPCSYEDLRDCLRDLAVVNRLTMAHRPVMNWLDRLPAPHPARPLKIVDVGCGYGDMLRRIDVIVLSIAALQLNFNPLTRSSPSGTPRTPESFGL